MAHKNKLALNPTQLENGVQHTKAVKEINQYLFDAAIMCK